MGASLSKAQKEGKTHFQEGEFYALKIIVINLAPSVLAERLQDIFIVS